MESSSGPCCDRQGERSGGPTMYVYVAWDLESGWWEGGVGPSEPCNLPAQPAQPARPPAQHLQAGPPTATATATATAATVELVLPT